jgi:tetratricopeptide (TPR) repeat protein
LQSFSKAIEVDPRNPVAYNNMGWTLLSIGRYSDAIGYYTKAIELNPSLENSKKGLAIAREKLKQDYSKPAPSRQTQSASTSGNQQADYRTQSDRSRTVTLEQLEQRGLTHKQIEQRELSLEQVEQRGLSNFKTGNYDEAIDDFTYLMSRMALSRRFRIYRSMAYLKKGFTDQAVSEMKQACINNSTHDNNAEKDCSNGFALFRDNGINVYSYR